jgi:hypothetical protein
MLGRTKSALALGMAVAVVAVGSLAGAPTAAACPIDSDGNCLAWHAGRIPTPQPKPKAKHAKVKGAPVHHSR